MWGGKPFQKQGQKRGKKEKLGEKNRLENSQHGGLGARAKRGKASRLKGAGPCTVGKSRQNIQRAMKRKIKPAQEDRGPKKKERGGKNASQKKTPSVRPPGEGRPETRGRGGERKKGPIRSRLQRVPTEKLKEGRGNEHRRLKRNKNQRGKGGGRKRDIRKNAWWGPN